MSKEEKELLVDFLKAVRGAGTAGAINFLMITKYRDKSFTDILFKIDKIVEKLEK